MSTITPTLTLPEVAEALGVHYMTAYRYVRTGRLPATKVGGTWLVDRSAFDAFGTGVAPAAAASGRRAAGRAPATRLEARLLAGDRRGSLDVVDATLAAGASWSEVQVQVLAPALRSIGDRWADGELTIGDEHRATVVAQHVLAIVGTRFTRRGRRRETVVIGAAPGEAHQIPVAIAADHVRAAGFDVVDFGADTPAATFAAAAGDLDPLAVIVGATTTGRDTAVRQVVRAVHVVAPAVPVLVGGAAITDQDAARRLGADGWTGPDAVAVVEAVEALGARTRDLEAAGRATR